MADKEINNDSGLLIDESEPVLSPGGAVQWRWKSVPIRTSDRRGRPGTTFTYEGYVDLNMPPVSLDQSLKVNDTINDTDEG